MLSEQQLRTWKEISARGYLLEPEFVLEIILELESLRAGIIELKEADVLNDGWEL